MALHNDLLEQAGHLASREPRRPRQASLRRAVSTAYYALFHLLTDEASRRLAPAQPGALRQQIRRGFTHREMQQLCRQFAAGSPGQQTSQLLQGPISPELKVVAAAFVALQDARHEADYDLAVTFTRSRALQSVQRARSAFASWAVIRSDPNATVFLAALLFQSQWRG